MRPAPRFFSEPTVCASDRMCLRAAATSALTIAVCISVWETRSCRDGRNSLALGRERVVKLAGSRSYLHDHRRQRDHRRSLREFTVSELEGSSALPSGSPQRSDARDGPSRGVPHARLGSCEEFPCRSCIPVPLVRFAYPRITARSSRFAWGLSASAVQACGHSRNSR